MAIWWVLLAGSSLTSVEVDSIVQQSIAAANKTRAVIRLPIGLRVRMVIAVSDTDRNSLSPLPYARQYNIQH